MAVFRGTNYNDHVVGTPDRDFIQGLGGNDVISGGKGDDELEGNQGNDTISGGAGDDFLYGNQGNDTLFGNHGNDNFMFTSGNGKDFVMDFTAGDRLHIEDGINHTGIHTLADLASRVEAAGSNTIVDLGEGNSITLSNVSAGDVQHHPENYFSIMHITDHLI
ncbi:hemolysin-type calcium-binding protein [Bradyrhizobium nanningense]|uniref:calcium-binding protein n=1 Tax=Bradyrhizobium nanningense TaxID=1325118 RepID=UPI00100929B3|nr:hemolysin-type calcium-binding protein [Bradyrhizobium nanningense]RXH35343.1 hemolysin-type calcium-binding protein [Bradyrhizobium nanningense]